MRYCPLLTAAGLPIAGLWLVLHTSGLESPASPIPVSDRGDTGQLQGVWIEEYTEHGGETVTHGGRFVFVGNRFFRLDGDRVIKEGSFAIDSSGSIWKIDYRCVKGYQDHRGADQVLTRRAIFELEGDSLNEVGPWGTDLWSHRPAAFVSRTDLANYRRVMKRETG